MIQNGGLIFFLIGQGLPIGCLHPAMRVGEEQGYPKVPRRNLRLRERIHRRRRLIFILIFHFEILYFQIVPVYENEKSESSLLSRNANVLSFVEASISWF